MNNKLALLILAGGSSLALVGSAAGTAPPATKSLRLRAPVEALAISGSRVAYDVRATYPAKGFRPNRVVVWNLATGKTVKVSGKQTEGADSTAWGGVTHLAIAGTKVAWLIEAGGNSEADDDLYTSSTLSPKERHVASEMRSGDQCGAGRAGYEPACAGTWLGGVVGSGNRILVNRWTTDTTGAITDAGLYALNGTKFARVAAGAESVEAVAADSKRVIALQWAWYRPDYTIRGLSSTGKSLFSVTPSAQPMAIAIGGRNLVVLEPDKKLAVYNAATGALRKTLSLKGNPYYLQALAVRDNIAVYATPVRYGASGSPRISESAIRAVNLSTGREREIGRLPGQITLARINAAGLVYTNSGNGFGPDRLVFVPLSRVAAAVS